MLFLLTYPLIQYTLTLVALAWLGWFIFVKKDPPPIAGIYTQPGKWFWPKYWIFYVFFKLRQRNIIKQSPDCAGYGNKSHSDISQMERVQKLSDKPHSFEAIYFNASNSDGVFLGAAMARRPQRVGQVFLIVRLPEVGTLELPCAPDTHVRASEKEEYRAGGLEMIPVEPMKKWLVKFKGPVKMNGEDFGEIEIELTWTACSEYFDYDTDMSPKILGKAIATEPWSKRFFDRLRTTHQTHYEQFGDYKGHLTITNQSRVFPLEMRGLRDHSYGIRDWKTFHRYMLNFFHLEDGTCVHVGMVSMPEITFTRLDFGFVCTPDGKKVSIAEVNVPVHLVAEREHDPPPSTFWLDFKTEDGKCYDVECHVIDKRPYYYGHEWEGMIWEQLCRYFCNGMPGWGLAEWEYRHRGGRPEITPHSEP